MAATAKVGDMSNFAASIRSKTGSAGQPDELRVDPNFEEDPTVAPVVEFAIKRRKNLLIVGPTGCGKSCLAINVMARLKERCEIFSCDGTTSTEELIAVPIATVDAKGIGITDVRFGAALRAYGEGKGLLLEEVDHGQPDIYAALHRIMEVNQPFYVCNVPGVVNQPVLPRHKDFFVIATANTIGTGEDTFIYTGTKALNAAFMNRFSLTVMMDYLPPAKEIEVLKKKTGIDEPTAKKMVQIANDVRDAANPKRKGGAPGSAKIASVISTRDLIEWCDLVIGMSKKPKIAAEYAFLNRIADADRDVVTTFITNLLP